MTVDRKAVAQAKRAATRKANQHKKTIQMLADAHRRMDERGYPKAKKR